LFYTRARAPPTTRVTLLVLSPLQAWPHLSVGLPRLFGAKDACCRPVIRSGAHSPQAPNDFFHAKEIIHYTNQFLWSLPSGEHGMEGSFNATFVFRIIFCILNLHIKIFLRGISNNFVRMQKLRDNISIPISISTNVLTSSRYFIYIFVSQSILSIYCSICVCVSRNLLVRDFKSLRGCKI